jgi:Sulfotransferase family
MDLGKPDARVAALLAFVHIPKTAGATVLTMLAAAYSKDGVRDAGNYFRSPERTIAKFAMPRKMRGEVLAGHVPYAVFRERLPADTRYMTFLREPVDRVLSHYYRHVFAKDTRVDKAIRRPRGRPIEEGHEVPVDLLEEALASGMPQLNNFATRFLCRTPSAEGELSERALYSARANLRMFAFIGFQERFEESIERLRVMLALDEVPYVDKHVNRSRPTVNDLPDGLRELILDHNRLDAALYDFALDLCSSPAVISKS